MNRHDEISSRSSVVCVGVWLCRSVRGATSTPPHRGRWFYRLRSFLSCVLSFVLVLLCLLLLFSRVACLAIAVLMFIITPSASANEHTLASMSRNEKT